MHSTENRLSAATTTTAGDDARTRAIRHAQDAKLDKAVRSARIGNIATLSALITEQIASRKKRGERECDGYRLWRATTSTSPYCKVTAQGVTTPQGYQYERVEKDGIALFPDCPDQAFCDKLNAAAAQYGISERVETKHATIFTRLTSFSWRLRWQPVAGGGGFVTPTLDESVAISDMVDEVLAGRISHAMASSRIKRRSQIALADFEDGLKLCQEVRARDAAEDAAREAAEDAVEAARIAQMETNSSLTEPALELAAPEMIEHLVPVLPTAVSTVATAPTPNKALPKHAKKLTVANCPTLARIKAIFGTGKNDLAAFRKIVFFANAFSLDYAIREALLSLSDDQRAYMEVHIRDGVSIPDAKAQTGYDFRGTLAGQIHAAIYAGDIDPNRERMIPIRLPGHANNRKGSYIYMPVAAPASAQGVQA